MIDLVLARSAMADRLDAIGFPAPIVAAMGHVPRHSFVPAPLWRLAYAETDLWLGACWLASPTVIARTLTALAPRPGQRVLELGTGCGYQTTLLSLLGAEVFTIEPLGGFDLTDGALLAVGDTKIHRSLGGSPTVLQADAPFDAIVVNTVLREVPPDLIGQLATGHGRLVAPMATAGGLSRVTVVRLDDDRIVRLHDAGVVPSLVTPYPGSLSGIGTSLPLEGARHEP